MSHATNLIMPLQVVQLREIFVASYHIFVVNGTFEPYIKY